MFFVVVVSASVVRSLIVPLVVNGLAHCRRSRLVTCFRIFFSLPYQSKALVVLLLRTNPVPVVVVQ